MASGWNVGAGELRASLGGLGHAPATRVHGPQKGTEVERGRGHKEVQPCDRGGRGTWAAQGDPGKAGLSEPASQPPEAQLTMPGRERGRSHSSHGGSQPLPLFPLQHDLGAPPQPRASPLPKREQETRATPSDLPLWLGQGVRSGSLAQNPGVRWLGEGGTHSPLCGETVDTPIPQTRLSRECATQAALRARPDSEHPSCSAQDPTSLLHRGPVGLGPQGS